MLRRDVNFSVIAIIEFEEWLTAVAASSGWHGGICPPRQRLCPPLSPSQKKKMGKISHFRQMFGLLPPQNRILSPWCPTTKEKKIWCRHWLTASSIIQVGISRRGVKTLLCVTKNYRIYYEKLCYLMRQLMTYSNSPNESHCFAG